MIKVQRNVPVEKPRRQTVPRDEFLQALREMRVGDSFEWEMSSYDRSAVYIAAVLLKRRFTTRQADKNGFRRIWRAE